MTYTFFIQGDGRGHLSQAIALREKLLARGHKINAVVVGAKSLDDLPDFFKEVFSDTPISTILSPRFAKDKNKQGIDIIKSLLVSIKNIPNYFGEVKKIKKLIANLQPDALISFYEPLAGIYWRLNKKTPLFCLGHQYFAQHPAFPIKSLNYLQRCAYFFYNNLAAPKGAVRIALSFTAEGDLINKNLYLVPPLIRTEIKEAVSVNQNFILSYVLNHGYFSEIIKWCQENPHQPVKCFGDKKNLSDLSLPHNLEINYLSGEKFISALKDCSGLATTAGFESVSEAAYLAKPILLIPTKNHFEQKSNAADALRAGIATVSSTFDLSLLSNQKTHLLAGQTAFRKWVDDNENKLLEILQR